MGLLEILLRDKTNNLLGPNKNTNFERCVMKQVVRHFEKQATLTEKPPAHKEKGGEEREKQFL